MNIGKIFQGLTQGGEVAEATNQLMQYGLVTGKAKVALQDFVNEAKAGKRAFLSEAEALEMLQKMFGKTEGAMARLAETTNGKISMVQDAMSQIRAAFGEGFNEGLKDALDGATNFIPKFQGIMKQAGEGVGLAISDAVAGDTSLFLKIGEVIGSLVARGIELGMDKTKGGMTKAVFGYLEHGGFKKGGVLPKGTTERITRGLDIEQSGKALDFAIDIRKSVKELNEEIALSRARKASRDLGLGGETIFTKDGLKMSDEALQQITAMRNLLERVVGQAANFYQ
jgi:hypothetical protein